MKFIDLFAGIGGFRTGMEMNGHECVAFCEIDKYARQSYKAIHDTEGEEEWHDITRVSDDDFRQLRGKADIITGGFPCQAFSVAGNRRGFEDTRGTLFFEIARAIKEIEPPYILLENVKGLFSHDKGRTFGTIIQALDELGYIVEWGLFNSKFWGVPQNRERVFILVTRKDVFTEPKLFKLLKQQKDVESKLIDVLEHGADEKYFLSDERTRELIKQFPKNQSDDVEGFNTTKDEMPYALTTRTASLYLPHHVRTSQATLISEKKMAIKEATKKGYSVAGVGDTRRGRVGKGVANTLEASGVNQGVVLSGLYTADSVRFSRPPLMEMSRTLKAKKFDAGITDGYRIRKLTPLECWRLQGFTDEQFYKAKNDGVSNSQLYKQAGNSVTVNVIDAIARRLSK